MQSAEKIVEVLERRGDAGQPRLPLVRRLRRPHRVAQGDLELLRAAVPVPALRQAEQMLLGVLDLPRRGVVDVRVVGAVDDFLAEVDQLAADREIVDRAAVVPGIDDGDRGAGESGEVLRAADVGQGVVVLEPASQRDRGRDLPALDQLPAGLVDAPVNGLEEMPRLQKFEHAVGRFVVDEDGAEQRLFGLDVVGRLPVGDALLASGLDDGGAGAEDGLINHGTAV